MPQATNQKTAEIFRHNDYRHLMQVRAMDLNDDGKMIVRGKAISFDDPTVLFTYEGNDYTEIIEKGALDEADLNSAYLKYNHSSSIMAMARYKNGTLKIDRATGEIEAELANTTSGRDLYELVRSGIIDKMSFAFTIEEESYNKEQRTWKVRKIGKVYDVAAVEVPAYENTDLFARRYGEVEANRRKEVEAQVQARKRKVDIIKLTIGTYNKK